MQDWKSYWFLLAGVQGLLLTVGLAARSKKNNSVIIYLAILIGVLSIELLTNFAVRVHYTNQPEAIPFWVIGSYLLIPPALLNLARHSVNLPLLNRKRSLMLLGPAMLEIVVELTVWLLRAAGFTTPSLRNIEAWVVFTEIIPVLATIAILGWWIMQLKKRAVIRNVLNASAKKQTLLIPLALLAYYSFLSLLWLAEALLSWRFSDLLTQLLAGSMLILGYIVFLRTGLFDGLSFVPVSSTPVAWQYDDADTVKQLLQLMEQERIYIQSRLSIDDLADKLQLPKRYLSYIIANKLNTTVIAFVNAYRVQEVIRKMKDPKEQHKTLLALAMEAGFNSKSTFNQVFKAQTGMTPSEYHKKTS
ncbi:MAG: hypothetical protein DI535_06235 [Citrobacter freundii]|nr:MAG: hypothetical protein DI535_06235 [Citrobacter freundii]